MIRWIQWPRGWRRLAFYGIEGCIEIGKLKRGCEERNAKDIKGILRNNNRPVISLDKPMTYDEKQRIGVYLQDQRPITHTCGDGGVTGIPHLHIWISVHALNEVSCFQQRDRSPGLQEGFS